MAEDLAPSREQLRAIAFDTRAILDYLIGKRRPWDRQADAAVERIFAIIGGDSWTRYGWPTQDWASLEFALLSVRTMVRALKISPIAGQISWDEWRSVERFLPNLDRLSSAGPSGPPSWHTAQPPSIPTPVNDPREPLFFGPRQKAIMDHLDGKAMRSRALAKALHIDQPSLYKRDGIKELMANGLVKTHRKIGYYRPDAPPSEHADLISTP
jgi:hypothetical protein